MASFTVDGTIKCVRSTDKAVLCEDEGGKTFWVPLSQVRDQSEVRGEGDAGVLVVSRWFADQRGWTRGAEDTPNLGVTKAPPPAPVVEPPSEPDAPLAPRADDAAVPEPLRPAPKRKGKRKALKLEVVPTEPVWHPEHLERERLFLNADAVTALATAKEHFDDYKTQTEVRALESSEVAALYLERWGKISARDAGRVYFHRFPATSAVALVPVALGRASKAQRAAVAWLSSMAPEIVAAAASRYGEEASAALEAELAHADPEPLYTEMPAKDAWYEELPAPVLAQGPAAGARLPVAAVRKLCILLANGDRARIQPALALLTPASARAFGWALYEGFRKKPDTDQSWMLYQLAHTADEAMLARLVMHVLDRASGLGTWNVYALQVLRTHGSQRGLLELSSLAAGRGKLAEAAGKQLEAYAIDEGLTRDELDDRLAPTLGLEEAVELDYGPRRFRLTFDHTLAPRVIDGDGTVRADLPRPTKSDDAAKVEAARTRFKQLTTDVRAIARAQRGRLEKALVDQRAWRRESFEAYLAGHPLLTHLAQRLIWVDGKTGTTFRVAEDHRLATVDDETYALEGGVRLLHPATAEPGVTDAWALVLADYELIQPFSQLQRPVHAFTEAERASGVFRRLDGKEAPLAKVLALRDRGWAPGEFDREHGSGYHDLVRGLPAGRGSLQLHLGAGIAPGVSGYRKTIPLKHVTLTFPAALDRITESELVAELLGLLDD